jgi:succinate dehydrogenase/fumarate reductase flavoprotein subunit
VRHVREHLKLKAKYEERMMSKKERLVIIGGSAAGPSAAARAKRVNPNLEVTMFEQGRFVSYGS